MIQQKLDACIAAFTELVHALSCNGGAPAKMTPQFPANFSVFHKAWKDANPENVGFVAEVFKRASAIVWTPANIRLVIMGDPQFDEAVRQPEAFNAVKSALEAGCGFRGALDMELKGTQPVAAEPTKRGRPAKAKETAAPAVPVTNPLVPPTMAPTPAVAAPVAKVTVAEVQAACVELARVHGRGAVVELLREYGAEKVAGIAPEKLGEVLNAVKNYEETSNSEF